jgi:hypothetical protein
VNFKRIGGVLLVQLNKSLFKLKDFFIGKIDLGHYSFFLFFVLVAGFA